MPRSLRSRIAIAYAALMVACVGAYTAYLAVHGQDFYLATLHRGIEGQARLVSAAARPYLLEPKDAAEIDRLARQLGAQVAARVTIIDRTGKVLGDSDHDPSTMDNHWDRPEVATAVRGGVGTIRRSSATTGYDTLYVAVPIEEGDRLLGVARVALPLSDINGIGESIVRAIALGGLAATGLAVGLALLVAATVTRPIKELTTVAGRMSEGMLDQRVGERSQDEVGQLARAFNSMADRLRTTIKTISSERNTLAAVLSTMADGILIVDGNGRVVLANRAAGLLLRAPPSWMEGKSYVEALRDHELSAVLQRCLEQGAQQSGTAEIGPGRRYVRIVAAPLRGEQTRALALLQDLTEVRRAETVRREFIANVSHELRTPLASLKAVVETLEEGAIDEPDVAREFLSKMHVEVDGLAQLVRELLELSRIESGQAALQVEHQQVELLVRRAVERLLAQVERAGLGLSIEVAPDLPTLMVDGQRVQQVLVNLIHNATKFTPAGGHIVVGAREGEGEIVLWVSDTGVGIAAEDLPRIFERFYKADRSRSGGGTGLGLAIARHVVEAHGGRIWAESLEGRGSTFYFTLPVAARSAER